MVPLMLLALVLASADPSPAPRIPGDLQDETESDSLDPVVGFAREESSLNEMFREVEELMEDTQHKLRNAVKEMEAEEQSMAETADVNLLPPNYHNESNTDTRAGNKTFHTHQEIDKITDNQTGSTIFSETVINSAKADEIKRNHECFIDEDCGPGKYCQITNFEYKCLLCKSQEKCSRDGECCGDEVCVWGDCTNAVAKGESGTICERQQDCNPGLCCAVQSSLLFPVCSQLPIEGELCHDPSGKLLEMIPWEMEPDGALDRCPCATGLICRPQSSGLLSICEQSSLNDEARSNEGVYPLDIENLPFFSAIPREASDDYDQQKIIQAMNNELEDLETDTSEKIDVQEPDSPDPTNEDEI